MMTPLNALWGFSILIAAIIAIVRFHKISKLYWPFILCVWIASANEVLSYVLAINGYYTSVNNNIYVLTEALLFFMFFKNMGIFEKIPGAFKIIMAGMIFLWLWENGVQGKITYVSSLFRIVYSFCIVLMSITVINKLMILDVYKLPEMDSRGILRNPVFLICVGAIVFFTFKMLVEIFWFYGLNHSDTFRMELYDILIYINLVVNGIYALAVLWMLPKQKYIML
jgi:hypothetical protein